MVDEVGEAGIEFLLFLLKHGLLRIHTLTLGVGFLLASGQFILLLVKLQLTLLDTVLRLLNLLVVLTHFLLEFCTLAQELLFYLKQFLLLDNLCLFLGILAGFNSECFSLCWHCNEVPYNQDDNAHYYKDYREGNYDVCRHEL